MLPFFQTISSSQLVEDWLRDDALSRLRTTFSAIEGAKLPMEPWEILLKRPSEMLDRVRIEIDPLFDLVVWGTEPPHSEHWPVAKASKLVRSM